MAFICHVDIGELCMYHILRGLGQGEDNEKAQAIPFRNGFSLRDFSVIFQICTSEDLWI